MTRVGVANRGNLAGVAGRGQPVPDRRSDRTAPGNRVCPGLARDQKQEPGSAPRPSLERVVKPLISGGKVMAVKVEHEIGLSKSPGKLPVPG